MIGDILKLAAVILAVPIGVWVIAGPTVFLAERFGLVGGAIGVAWWAVGIATCFVWGKRLEARQARGE